LLQFNYHDRPVLFETVNRSLSCGFFQPAEWHALARRALLVIWLVVYRPRNDHSITIYGKPRLNADNVHICDAPRLSLDANAFAQFGEVNTGLLSTQWTVKNMTFYFWL